MAILFALRVFARNLLKGTHRRNTFCILMSGPDVPKPQGFARNLLRVSRRKNIFSYFLSMSDLGFEPRPLV